MKKIGVVLVSFVMLLISYSCGVDGDPGHCYISVDWEYYNEDYGVNYYEDNNPDVPDGINLVAGQYYDSYPGTYDYYYESEDPEWEYTYEGTYTLVQNPGTYAHLFQDGMDGIDTFFDLYLLVKARKSVSSAMQDEPGKLDKKSKEKASVSFPESVEEFSWEETKNGWTLKFTQVVSKYKKVQ